MFDMNILHLSTAIALAIFAGSIVACIGAAVYAFNPKQTDNEKQSKIIKRCAQISLIFLAIAIIVVISVVYYYNKHGAFYDDAWRDPDVDNHFIWTTDDTEFLQSIYDTDPDNFKPELYDVILVRLGCDDCEKIQDIILSAENNDDLYIIFSRSTIGQIYVNKYDIKYVPCTVIDGIYVPLYDEENMTDQTSTSAN